MSEINAADVYQRIRVLEEQVAFLARAVNVNLPTPEAVAGLGVPQEVIDIVMSGDKIGAIKRYRELTGTDMHEAKDVVDNIV
jgi:ribosomal protein L7/L12